MMVVRNASNWPMRKGSSMGANRGGQAGAEARCGPVREREPFGLTHRRTGTPPTASGGPPGNRSPERSVRLIVKPLRDPSRRHIPRNAGTFAWTDGIPPLHGRLYVTYVLSSVVFGAPIWAHGSRGPRETVSSRKATKHAIRFANPVASPGFCILLAGSRPSRMTDKDITAIVQRWAAGDASALDQLMPLVYNDLRRLAHSRLRNEGSNCTLQATALVHEVFLRLAGQREPDMQNRGQFFHLAAALMRRILIDHAKRRKALKRGGGMENLELDEALASTPEKLEEWLAVDEALERFAAIDPFRARVVELRYFAGFSVDEVAELMGISATTARRDWAVARCWLQRRLENSRRGSANLEPGQ